MTLILPLTRSSAPSEPASRHGSIPPEDRLHITREIGAAHSADPVLSDTRVIPLLPLVAAIWDSNDPPELEEVRLEVIRVTSNDLVRRVMLERWLNQAHPPSPTDLMMLRAHIRYHLGELAEGRPTAWSAPVLVGHHTSHEHNTPPDDEWGTYFG